MAPGDPDLRASDVERERAADELGEHLALGRISADELETRLDAVYAARTRGALDEVLRDLPVPVHVPVHAASQPSPPSPCGWASWALTGVVCLLVWLCTSVAHGEAAGFWPVWVIGPWGLVVLARALPRARRGEPS